MNTLPDDQQHSTHNTQRTTHTQNAGHTAQNTQHRPSNSQHTVTRRQHTSHSAMVLLQQFAIPLLVALHTAPRKTEHGTQNAGLMLAATVRKPMWQGGCRPPRTPPHADNTQHTTSNAGAHHTHMSPDTQHHSRTHNKQHPLSQFLSWVGGSAPHICIYIYIYMHMLIYIYIYICVY